MTEEPVGWRLSVSSLRGWTAFSGVKKPEPYHVSFASQEEAKCEKARLESGFGRGGVVCSVTPIYLKKKTKKYPNHRDLFPKHGKDVIGLKKVIHITLSAPTPSQNSLSGGSNNWRAVNSRKRKLQKMWAEEIWLAPQWPENTIPWPRARMTITRYSAGTLDYGNLVGGCKPLIDLLQPMHSKRNTMGLGIIAGDAPHQLTCEYRQVKCKRAEARTEITIEEWKDD